MEMPSEFFKNSCRRWGVNKTSVKKKITQEVKRVLPEERPGDFNQALIRIIGIFDIVFQMENHFCENCQWESMCNT